jgi:hypothetical protein
MPDVLWAFEEVRDGLLRQARLADRRWFGQEADPTPILVARTLLQAFGWPALLAVGPGLLLLARRRPRQALLLAAVPLAYLAVVLSKALFFARFALPLVPFACLFAAYALVWTWSRVRAPLPRRALASLLCLAALGPPALLGLRLDALASTSDTRLLARDWLLANLPLGAQVAVQRYSIPITFEDDELARRLRLTRFESLTDRQQLTRLSCAGNRYLLTSSFQMDRQQTVGRGEPTGYQMLPERGRQITAFYPGPDGGVPFHVDDAGLPFIRILAYTRPGPTIRVYELAGGCG